MATSASKLAATGRSLQERVGASALGPMDPSQLEIVGPDPSSIDCSRMLEWFVPLESKEKLLELSFIISIKELSCIAVVVRPNFGSFSICWFSSDLQTFRRELLNYRVCLNMLNA